MLDYYFEGQQPERLSADCKFKTKEPKPAKLALVSFSGDAWDFYSLGV
jgi:hypothetical protein